MSYITEGRIVVVPDIHYPIHNRRAVRAVLRYIIDTQPEAVLCVGDLMDFPQPSRWSRGSAEEFAGSALKDCMMAKREFLQPLRIGYDGPILFHEGNHDMRPRTYISKYAPALAGFDAFNIDKLLDFDGFGVTLLPDWYKIAPGWISGHGHLGQLALSKIAGSTALNGAKKFNASLVMGHTHRLAAVPFTTGVGGITDKVIWGLEAGHLSDMRKADYLKQGTANWQTGFGELHISGQHVRPTVVPIDKGRFVVDGETWKL
jgi:predicted phosphodiesterase